MLAGGLRHWGQLEKPGGEDQELILGCRSLTLGCITSGITSVLNFLQLEYHMLWLWGLT